MPQYEPGRVQPATTGAAKTAPNKLAGPVPVVVRGTIVEGPAAHSPIVVPPIASPLSSAHAPKVDHANDLDGTQTLPDHTPLNKSQSPPPPKH
ncbi:hypothetical protein DIPPA_09961 [Diplonema papillatum]|nr:hypothetical protein DIPPA_09961 [Diplonema papillatum]